MVCAIDSQRHQTVHGATHCACAARARVPQALHLLAWLLALCCWGYCVEPVHGWGDFYAKLSGSPFRPHNRVFLHEVKTLLADFATLRFDEHEVGRVKHAHDVGRA